MATEWAVNTPKGQVRLGDLPLDTLCDLEDETGDEWWNIAAHPFRKAKTARSVYAAACRFIKCEPADLTLRDLVDTFEQVEEDLPELYEGGIPKADGEAGSGTPGSSGEPSDSTGHLTSPDDNRSET
jgi:hypothetical protein